MKPTNQKKVLGLALGEKSLMAAEVIAGDRPRVAKVAELVYPPEIQANEAGAAQLGKLLTSFLKERGFTASTAVVGIPLKWVAVKQKEVPRTDSATLANMLRLQAEAEFSSELKDLVFDFVETRSAGAEQSVLLIATPRRHIELAEKLCEAARLKLLAVTPSALALGETTSRAMARDVLVLNVLAGGSELTDQQAGSANAIRLLRASNPPQAITGELRRAVSTLPPGTQAREMIVWDGVGMDAGALGQQLGFTVRNGALPSLGVDDSLSGANGDGQRYAAAVALAASALGEATAQVDFLHSRLAAPKKKIIPRWVYLAAAAFVIVVVGGIYAYDDLQNREMKLADLQSRLTNIAPELKTAQAFVGMVSFAQAWHATDPRYLACLRDLTQAIPDDGQTYATMLTIKENVAAATGSVSAGAVPKTPVVNGLSGQIYGKSSDQQHVEMVLDRMKHMSTFANVALEGTNNLGRMQQVSFSITFDYPNQTPAPASTPAQAPSKAPAATAPTN